MYDQQAYKIIIRNSFALIVFLLFTNGIFAQTNKNNDSVYIYKWLNKADYEAITGSLDTALQFAKIALELSKQQKMLRGEGFAQLKIADILSQQESPLDLNVFYTEGLRIGSQLKDSFMIALAYYQHGQQLMYSDQLEEAEKLYNKSLALYFEKQQSSYTAQVYNDKGYLYGLEEKFEKQAEFYLEAVRIYDKLHDQSGLATTSSNLGNLYKRLGNTAKAFEYIRSAIAIREKTRDIQGLTNSYESLSRLYYTISLDSASKYQQVAMKYAEKSGVKSLMMRSYDNLSVLMDRLKRKQEAIDYINKSIALCREMNNKPELASKYRWAGLMYGNINDTAKMEAYFKEGYDISVQLKNKTQLRDLYGTKASYYSTHSDFKNAYDNLKKYYLYRDSLVNDETATNIAGLQTKYETEKKDNEITRLNTAQKIKQLEIEKQKAIISGNLLEAKQKENEIKLLSQQQELADINLKQQSEQLEKQILLAKNNKQELLLAEAEKIVKDKEIQNQKQWRNGVIVALLLSVILGIVLFNRYQLKKKLQQQKELLAVRNNIASDLHDEIGSALTSIKILSQSSYNNIQKDQQKASAMMEMITEQSSQMQQGMSDIVWAINPLNDKFENMLVRMREYISHSLEPKNIKTVFKVDEGLLSKSLGMEQRRDFFLVFKEAINNIAKYAEATEVNIRLSGDTKKTSLVISDNGIGFDQSTVRSSNGLRNMKTRTEALNGKFSIHTEPGKGVKIITEIFAT